MNKKSIDLYNQLFEMKIAKTKKELKQVYTLRYDVYTKENKWEPENESKLEIDKYDSHSVHSLLIFKPTNEVVGTVRIVKPNHKNLLKSYPIQEHCDHSHLKDEQYLSRMAEISRMAISKNLRKKIITSRKLWWFILLRRQSPKKIIAELSSCMSAGLMASILYMVTEEGLQGTFALLEPVFIRMLRKTGITGELLGPTIEYHGKRQPCYFDLTTMTRAKTLNADIYNFMSHNGELERKLRDICRKDKNSPFKKLVR